MRPILQDVHLDRSLRRRGYANLGPLFEGASEELRAQGEELLGGASDSAGATGFQSSTASVDLKFRDRLYDVFAPIFERAAAEHLDGYTLLNVAYLVKHPDDQSELGAHQDWSFVDEALHRSVSLWVPLVDVDDSNGALGVVPGSHHVLSSPRTSPRPPGPFERLMNEFKPDDFTTISITAGHGLVTDHGLIHWSPPNRSNQPRPVLAAAFVPKAAPLFHFHRRSDDSVERYRVPDAGWFRSFQFGSEPTGAHPDGQVPWTAPALTAGAVVRRAARAAGDTPTAALRRGFYARRAPAPIDSSTDDSVSNLVEAQPCTFKDPDIEERFREDGYVVVDLLGGAELETLQSAYGALDHRPSWDSPFAQGFHTTLYDDRANYRTSVLAAIEASFDDGLQRLLADHEVLFANFAVKRPGGGPVPQHLDWTFVDEQQFCSATVWCPLAPADLQSGSLGVVSKSHRQVTFVRPVNRRDYGTHADLADDDTEEVVLSLDAGQAVVMDNRTVHFSPPNRSQHDRVAAACVVAPRQSQPVHYWLGSDDVMFRLDVSRDFYLNYRIGEDPRSVDGVGSIVAVDESYA